MIVVVGGVLRLVLGTQPRFRRSGAARVFAVFFFSGLCFSRRRHVWETHAVDCG